MAEIKKYLDTTALGTLVDQIKAEDTKVLDAAKKYTDDVGKLYDATGSAATAEENAKKYTDELANGAVATNTAAIAKLNGDGEGSVAKAVADAKTVIDADVDAVEAIANQNKVDIATINNTETGILAQAKKYTDDEVAGVQEEVNNLEKYVGTIPEGATATDIVGYVQEKTSGIATESALSELQTSMTQAQKDIDAIEADYLKTADKTELEGKITTAQTAADNAQAHSEGVASDLTEAVETLEAADEAQIERIAALEGTIVGLSGAMHFEGVKTEVPTDVTGYEQGDVIIVGNKEYVLNGDAFVEFGDASVNAEAITALTGKVNTLETDMTQAKTDIDNVEAAVATKAEQTYVDEAIQTLEGADTELGKRITALEGQLGESGDVAQDIADAKAEAIDAAKADATTKANTAEQNAKDYADGLDAAMDERVDALETATHTHGNKALLDTYTQTEENLADAVAKKHEHSNLSILEAITAAKVAAWDVAEKNAKDYADSLNTTMQSVVDGVSGRVTTLESTITTKADADDLDDAVTRIAQNETNIANLTSSVNSFTPISSSEVEALFA